MYYLYYFSPYLYPLLVSPHNWGEPYMRGVGWWNVCCRVSLSSYITLYCFVALCLWLGLANKVWYLLESCFLWLCGKQKVTCSNLARHLARALFFLLFSLLVRTVRVLCVCVCAHCSVQPTENKMLDLLRFLWSRPVHVLQCCLEVGVAWSGFFSIHPRLIASLKIYLSSSTKFTGVDY